MFHYEWKKLLIYRKGLWLITLLLVTELLGLLLFTSTYDKILENNRDIYDAYLQQVEGPLTQEKRDYIEDEMLRLNTVHYKLEELKSKYYTGEVSEEKYRAEYDMLAAEDQYFQGFSKLYTQYIYVREQENRSFLYTGGWEVLLGNRDADYLYLLVLVFLLAPLFCQEYGSQMDQIGVAQKKSAHCLWRVKLSIALLLTAALTALLQVFDLAYCAMRFGLPNWNYSIQSLVSFGAVEKALPLWKAFVLQFLLKEIGYLYAAISVMFTSVMVRKYPLTLMICLVCLPLPLLAVQNTAAFVRIPGPWAMTVGSVYLQGSGQYLGSNIYPYTEVRWIELLAVTLCSSAVMVCMILIIRQKNMNYHGRFPKRMASVMILLVVLILSGCSSDNEQVIYNSKESNWAENQQYLVFSDTEDTLILDKQSNTYQSFPMDAFGEETVFNQPYFYCNDHTLYYLQSIRQKKSAGLDVYRQQDTLMSLDLQTMRCRAIYHWKSDSQWFFGLLQKNSWEPQANLYSSFFIHDRYLFLLGNNTLVRMSLNTGKYEDFLTLTNACNVAYDGKNIYYMDAYSRLVIQDLDIGSLRIVEEVAAKDFLLTPEGIYFLNMRANGSLSYWDETSGAVKQLDTSEGYALHWDSKYCWVETMEGLIRINHDGSDRTTVDYPGHLVCITDSNSFFSTDYITGTIFMVKKDTFLYEQH